MKLIKYYLISLALVIPGAYATEIKLPGIEINDDKVVVGGIKIDSDGVDINGGISIRESTPGRKTHTPEGAAQPERSSYVKANYAKADFSGQDLAGARMTRSNFSQANFDGADLSGAVIERTNMSGASFIGACLDGAVFISSNFSKSDFTDAVLSNTTNQRSNFNQAILTGVSRHARCGSGSHGSVEQQNTVSIVNETLAPRADITDSSTILSVLSAGPSSEVDLTVHFKHDSDQLSGQAYNQIQEIAAALLSPELASISVRIEGHTDSTGDNEYNLALSLRRAAAVQDVLNQQFGLDPSRIEVRGYGENRPIETNANRAGRAMNRRVTLVNLGN